MEVVKDTALHKKESNFTRSGPIQIDAERFMS